MTSVGFRDEYNTYKNLLNQHCSQISANIGTKVDIIPTSKRICKKSSVSEEAANSLNTALFLESVYSLLKEKGYRVPYICIDEAQLPRKFNLSGFQMGNWNVFGPGRLDVSSPELVIHEAGHFLHNKNMVYNQSLYAMFNSFRGLVRPFLNKNEKRILVNDIKRAYDEGYYRNLQLDKSLKKGYVNEKQLAAFYREPEKILSLNPLSNVSEFVAEYFTLAAQGFEFSPEITKRYKAFHGPDIKKIITADEINKLMGYKESLEKRIRIDI